MNPSTWLHLPAFAARSASAAFAAALVLGGHPAGASTITAFTTLYDTDFVTAGTGGLRGAGTGTITVTGVTGSATQSYLYWHGPTNSTDPAANANVLVNGAGVTGTNIGFAFDNFWGFANSQAYRADTTPVIAGNGTFALSGFSKPPGVQVNGAAAIVAFQDGDSSNNRDVVVFNGNDGNFASDYDAAGWDVTLPGIRYSGGVARLTFIVSDGQNFSSTDDGTLRINGMPLVTGGIFQGDTLPGASIGNGNLFDIKTYDITGFLTPGANSLRVTLDPGFSDALSLVGLLVDLPAGAAPPTTVPEPASVALLGFGVVGLAVRRRRADAGVASMPRASGA